MHTIKITNLINFFKFFDPPPYPTSLHFFQPPAIRPYINLLYAPNKYTLIGYSHWNSRCYLLMSVLYPITPSARLRWINCAHILPMLESIAFPMYAIWVQPVCIPHRSNFAPSSAFIAVYINVAFVFKMAVVVDRFVLNHHVYGV